MECLKKIVLMFSIRKGKKSKPPGLNLISLAGLNLNIPGLNIKIPGLNPNIPGLCSNIPSLNSNIPGLNYLTLLN